MPSTEPTFTFGVEEEYYLVDITTRALAKETPKRLMASLRTRLGKQFSEEYMRSQVEICTPVCTDIATARDLLVEYRNAVADEAKHFGLAPIAAATHPFSRWRHQRHRDKPRYNAIAEDFQALGKRMLVCGQHVHIGIEDPEARIVVMNELRQYLPLLLALSTSSPFWGGETTGLKSYRMAINDSTPRKGIPEHFHNWAHFKGSVDILIAAGIIEDASKIWWDLRPSVSYGTIEARIMDVCPLVDDAIALTALLRCLCRFIWRTHADKPATLPTSLILINENRWRAQRYGVEEGQIDPTSGSIQPLRDILATILEAIAEDAAVLNCSAEVAHTQTILHRGTSADRQLTRFQQQTDIGAPREAALVAVVDQLMAETLARPGAATVAGVTQRPAEATL